MDVVPRANGTDQIVRLKVLVDASVADVSEAEARASLRGPAEGRPESSLKFFHRGCLCDLRRQAVEELTLQLSSDPQRIIQLFADNGPAHRLLAEVHADSLQGPPSRPRSVEVSERAASGT